MYKKNRNSAKSKKYKEVDKKYFELGNCETY